MTGRPDWDNYFLDIAIAVSARANCSRRAAGAVVVDREHRIISTGYNGAPAGMDGCLEGFCPRGLHNRVAPLTPYDDPQSPGYCTAIHAEMNALLWAGSSVQYCTLYVTSDPCPNCIKHAAGAGIVRFVYRLHGVQYEMVPAEWIAQSAGKQVLAFRNPS